MDRGLLLEGKAKTPWIPARRAPTPEVKPSPQSLGIDANKREGVQDVDVGHPAQVG